MQTRQLGNSELYLTPIGFGAWAIGGPWDWGWGIQDDRDSIKAIHEALDLGVNWIDTAPAYGLGHSEEVVGKAIRGRRDKVIVATKCGLAWDEPAGRSVINRLKAWSIRREAEASLRRLGVDAIDLYQIHWPFPDPDIEEAWMEIARLVQEGKVRHAGVSNFTTSQIRRIQPIHPVTSLQPPYNLIERSIESELLPFCKAQNIGVIAYSPMSSGLLTGKYTRETIAALPADDWRHKEELFQEPKLKQILALLDALRPIAQKNGKNLGQLAVAWVLCHPEITAAIVGARRPGQITEIIPAADWIISDTDLQEIQRLL